MNKGHILVTGGAGYIGSHTVVALAAAGYVPVILDNFCNSRHTVMDSLQALTGSTLTLVEADCTDAEACLNLLTPLHAQSPFVGIIHFAAYKAVGESMDDPLKYYHNNLAGMVSVLRWQQALNIPTLVFSSSCTVYGQPQAADLPVTEQLALGSAHSPYGYTKQVCERMIADYIDSKATALSACLLRYFNPIGAHPSAQIGELPLGKPQNLVPFATQATAGWLPPLRIFGRDYPTPDGTCIRDYIHVCDLATAHVQALDYLLASPPQALTTLNVGTGEGVSVQQVVDTFAQATGIAVPHEYAPRRAGDVAAIYADNTAIRKTLGWAPQYSLADALRHAWAWQQLLHKD